MGQAGGIFSAAAALGGGIAQSQASRAQGNIARTQSEVNAKVAEGQASDAIRRGEREAMAQKAKVRQTMGAQRAAQAAQGIDIGSDSAIGVVGDTAYYGEIDVQTIKNNAYREAFGYKQQASNIRSQGRLDYIASRAEAKSSLLTGGMQAASYASGAWGEYRKGGKRDYDADVKVKSTRTSTGGSNRDRGSTA
jgi:hypothetical protein